MGKKKENDSATPERCWLHLALVKCVIVEKRSAPRDNPVKSKKFKRKINQASSG